MKIDNGMELKNNKKTEQEITVPVVCLKAKVKKLRERECVCATCCILRASDHLKFEEIFEL